MLSYWKRLPFSMPSAQKHSIPTEQSTNTPLTFDWSWLCTYRAELTVNSYIPKNRFCHLAGASNFTPTYFLPCFLFLTSFMCLTFLINWISYRLLSLVCHCSRLHVLCLFYFLPAYFSFWIHVFIYSIFHLLISLLLVYLVLIYLVLISLT